MGRPRANALPDEVLDRWARFLHSTGLSEGAALALAVRGLSADPSLLGALAAAAATTTTPDGPAGPEDPSE